MENSRHGQPNEVEKQVILRSVQCQVCGDGGGQHNLVCCENLDQGCTGGCHLYCFVPTRSKGPDYWVCKFCTDLKRKTLVDEYVANPITYPSDTGQYLVPEQNCNPQKNANTTAVHHIKQEEIEIVDEEKTTTLIEAKPQPMEVVSPPPSSSQHEDEEEVVEVEVEEVEEAPHVLRVTTLKKLNKAINKGEMLIACDMNLKPTLQVFPCFAEDAPKHPPVYILFNPAEKGVPPELYKCQILSYDADKKTHKVKVLYDNDEVDYDLTEEAVIWGPDVITVGGLPVYKKKKREYETKLQDQRPRWPTIGEASAAAAAVETNDNDIVIPPPLPPAAAPAAAAAVVEKDDDDANRTLSLDIDLTRDDGHPSGLEVAMDTVVVASGVETKAEAEDAIGKTAATINALAALDDDSEEERAEIGQRFKRPRLNEVYFGNAEEEEEGGGEGEGEGEGERKDIAAQGFNHAGLQTKSAGSTWGHLEDMPDFLPMKTAQMIQDQEQREEEEEEEEPRDRESKNKSPERAIISKQEEQILFQHKFTANQYSDSFNAQLFEKGGVLWRGDLMVEGGGGGARAPVNGKFTTYELCCHPAPHNMKAAREAAPLEFPQQSHTLGPATMVPALSYLGFAEEGYATKEEYTRFTDEVRRKEPGALHPWRTLLPTSFYWQAVVGLKPPKYNPAWENLTAALKKTGKALVVDLPTSGNRLVLVPNAMCQQDSSVTNNNMNRGNAKGQISMVLGMIVSDLDFQLAVPRHKELGKPPKGLLKKPLRQQQQQEQKGEEEYHEVAWPGGISINAQSAKMNPMNKIDRTPPHLDAEGDGNGDDDRKNNDNSIPTKAKKVVHFSDGIFPQRPRKTDEQMDKIKSLKCHISPGAHYSSGSNHQNLQVVRDQAIIVASNAAAVAAAVKAAAAVRNTVYNAAAAIDYTPSGNNNMDEADNDGGEDSEGDEEGILNEKPLHKMSIYLANYQKTHPTVSQLEQQLKAMGATVFYKLGAIRSPVDIICLPIAKMAGKWAELNNSDIELGWRLNVRPRAHVFEHMTCLEQMVIQKRRFLASEYAQFQPLFPDGLAIFVDYRSFNQHVKRWSAIPRALRRLRSSRPQFKWEIYVLMNKHDAPGVLAVGSNVMQLQNGRERDARRQSQEFGELVEQTDDLHMIHLKEIDGDPYAVIQRNNNGNAIGEIPPAYQDQQQGVPFHPPEIVRQALEYCITERYNCRNVYICTEDTQLIEEVEEKYPLILAASMLDVMAWVIEAQDFPPQKEEK